ncbi:Omp28-related outer membrane protein [bacterium]|nr:Omp28-related outer membrane protein [bacterium]
MKYFRYPVLTVFLLAMALQGCDVKAVNEPGQDIQAPTIGFTTPTSADSLSVGTVDVIVTVSDNDAVQKVEISLDGTVFATLTGEPWQSSFEAEPLSEGSHELKAVAYDAAGNMGQTKLTLKKGDTQVEEVPRMSLMEIVTSANCGPCAPQNETWHTAMQSAVYRERVATIKYHVWWPRSTDELWHHSSEWSKPRVDYLFDPIPPAQYGAPNGWVGGEMISNRASNWISSTDVDMQKPAGAKIELESSKEGNVISLTIRVTGISTSGYSDLRLHTAVTESEIEYNDGNAENIHYEVMRRMYPDAQGETVTIGNGQLSTFQRSITIDDEWNADHLEAVVFLQSKGSKEVLQAAKLEL